MMRAVVGYCIHVVVKAVADVHGVSIQHSADTAVVSVALRINPVGDFGGQDAHNTTVSSEALFSNTTLRQPQRCAQTRHHYPRWTPFTPFTHVTSPIVVGVEGRKSHVVEDAKAVGDGAHAVQLHSRVVSRRPYGAEGVMGLPMKYPVDGFQNRSCWK